MKQDANAWNKRLDRVLKELKFKCSEVNQNLYVRRESCGDVVSLVVYVDDLLLFSSNRKLKETVIEKLEKKFKMRNRWVA